MQNYNSKRLNGGAQSQPPPFAKFILYIIIILFIVLSVRQIYRKLHHEPTTAQEYHMLAKSLGIKGEFEQAEKAAKKALAIDPEFAKAYIDLGNIYTYQGDYIKAEQVYKSALEYIGDDKINREIIYYDLGGIYERERRPEESWEYFLRAYEIKTFPNPQYWKNNVKSPVQFVMRGDREGFIQHIKDDSAIPEEVHKRKQTVRGYLRSNDKKLVEECKKYLRDNPGSRYSYLFIALMTTALLNMNQLDEATENLKMLDNLDLPKDYIAWLKHTYAYISYQKKDYPDALRYLQDIVNNYPEYKSLEEVKSLIEDIQRHAY